MRPTTVTLTVGRLSFPDRSGHPGRPDTEAMDPSQPRVHPTLVYATRNAAQARQLIKFFSHADKCL